jgi:hypothetical protein
VDLATVAQTAIRRASRGQSVEAPGVWLLGLSSIKPNDVGDELDGGQKVARGLLVAGCDRTELLDLGEEALDQMALAIKRWVIVAQRYRLARGGITAVLPAAASGSRTRSSASNALSAISVSASIVGRGSAPTRSCPSPAGQEKAERIAERIDQCMDLGAQSAADGFGRQKLA